MAGRASAGAAPGDAFFHDPVIRTFRIKVEEPALVVLQKNDRSYVRATIQEGTNVYRDVGIHLKGMGSFRPFNEKPSLAVKFDRYVSRQRFHGLTKLMFNNASQDGTYLAELLATQMFRDAGVPAARVTHAFVEMNDRALGLYVVIEAMNKDFLRQYFDNPTGNLYEAYLQDINQPLDQDGGPDSNQDDLKRLLAVCNLTDRAERWRRLPDVLDRDRYISHLVVEMFTSHTDGYALNRNNYRLYRDPSVDRFVFLAHGIDWAFAATGHPIRPPRNSIVTKAVLETAEGPKHYAERVRQLFTNVFQLDVLTNRVNAAVGRLKNAARNTNEWREFEAHGQEMRNRLVARHKSIADQLAVPEPQPVQFGPDGTARLKGWAVRKERGEAVLELRQVEGKPLLYLRADKGKTEVIASWRTKVLLPEGRYALEGLARTAQVVPLTNTVKRGNGVGLRHSGGERKQELIGDQGWTALRHEFEVQPGDDERELICEIRAIQGEAWFDSGSLRLVRNPPPDSSTPPPKIGPNAPPGPPPTGNQAPAAK
jgi:spore coat protein CotH